MGYVGWNCLQPHISKSRMSDPRHPDFESIPACMLCGIVMWCCHLHSSFFLSTQWSYNNNKKSKSSQNVLSELIVLYWDIQSELPQVIQHTPSSGLHQHYIYMVHTHAHRKSTHSHKMKISMCFKIFLTPNLEMARLEKHLLCKCEDLSSDPWAGLKAVAEARDCSPDFLWWDERDAADSQEALGPDSLAYTVVKNKGEILF